MRKNDPNDPKKSFFRTMDRFFQVNGQWYFSAREGDIGPFRSRQQALREAEAYITARNANRESATEPRLGRHDHWAETTVVPGYVYRSVLSMEQRVSSEHPVVLELED